MSKFNQHFTTNKCGFSRHDICAVAMKSKLLFPAGNALSSANWAQPSIFVWRVVRWNYNRMRLATIRYNITKDNNLEVRSKGRRIFEPAFIGGNRCRPYRQENALAYR